MSELPQPIGEILASATRDIARAVNEHPVLADGDDLRERGRHRTHLAAVLADLVAATAADLADGYLLGEHDPHVMRRLARASRTLSELRQALETAQHAAREYTAAMAALAPGAERGRAA